MTEPTAATENTNNGNHYHPEASPPIPAVPAAHHHCTRMIRIPSRTPAHALLTLSAVLTPLATGATELNLDGVKRYSGSAASEEQVTSITQFSDVQPTDWAYQALSNLIERYGCVAGYHRRAEAPAQGIREGTRRSQGPRGRPRGQGG